MNGSEEQLVKQLVEPRAELKGQHVTKMTPCGRGLTSSGAVDSCRKKDNIYCTNSQIVDSITVTAGLSAAESWPILDPAERQRAASDE